jgi:hypothetical protein
VIDRSGGAHARLDDIDVRVDALFTMADLEH